MGIRVSKPSLLREALELRVPELRVAQRMPAVMAGCQPTAPRE